jgi:hypothetical protein
VTAYSTTRRVPGMSIRRSRRTVGSGAMATASTPSTIAVTTGSAGFVDVEEHDLTPAYLPTARRKLSEVERLADGMVEMLGPEEFDECQARHRRAVGAITDGLLRRSRFVARRPAR